MAYTIEPETESACGVLSAARTAAASATVATRTARHEPSEHVDKLMVYRESDTTVTNKVRRKKLILP